MKIDPKAKKSLTIALILFGGVLFVGVAFFALMSQGGQKPSAAPAKLPNMSSVNETKNPDGTEIEDYASMSKTTDKQNAAANISAGGAYLPEFSPPPEDVNKQTPPPTDVMTIYAQSSSASDSKPDLMNEKKLAERMKRLDALAASLLSESYAPVQGGDSWIKNETQENSSRLESQPIEQARAASKILIKAGEKAFVQIDTAINTDEPSPVNATIISGPGTGYVMFGTSRLNPNNTVSVEFTRLTLPSGVAVPITAYAIDPETGRTSIAGSVDHKIFERFVLPTIAAGLAKYGEIVAQQGAVTNVSPLAGNTTTTQNLTRHQIRDAAVGAGIGQMTGVLSANAQDAKPAVTTERNLGIEVIFMQEVIIPAEG